MPIFIIQSKYLHCMHFLGMPFYMFQATSGSINQNVRLFCFIFLLLFKNTFRLQLSSQPVVVAVLVGN